MNQPKILNIKIGVEGTQIILNALAKLPFEQVAELIAVIKIQAEQQLNPPAQQQAAPQPATEPAKRKGGRPKGSRNKPKAAPAPVASPVAGDNEGATAD